MKTRVRVGDYAELHKHAVGTGGASLWCMDQEWIWQLSDMLPDSSYSHPDLALAHGYLMAFVFNS